MQKNFSDFFFFSQRTEKLRLILAIWVYGGRAQIYLIGCMRGVCNTTNMSRKFLTEYILGQDLRTM